MEFTGYTYGQRKISALKSELCLTIFCDDAIYFAHISKKRQKETSKMLSKNAKAEGKGLIGRTKAVLQTANVINNEIVKLSIDEMMIENEMNFSIVYEKIQTLKMTAPHKGLDSEGIPTYEDGALKIKSDQKINMKISKIYYASEIKDLIKSKVGKNAKFRHM